jgi:leucyl aminopeptidase (aminopeptidase T)
MRPSKQRSAGVAVSFALLPLLAFGAAGAGPRDHSAGLADKVVGGCAGVAEGELVQITGDPRDVALLEDLAVAVRRRGAHPLVTLRSDRLARRLFDEVPEKFDAQVPELNRRLAGLLDAWIQTDADDESALSGVPAARVAASGKAGAPVWALLRKRGVRVVWLGNGLYPTAARARQLGMSEAELKALFRAALDVDYERMHARGDALRASLSLVKELRLTAPNGTDLKMGIAGRSAGVNDGVIGPEKRKQGGAACWAWLPAGEVFVTPVSGTAEGKLVVDRCLFEGKEVRGLTLNFKAGKVTEMAAESGGERLREVYREAPAGKDLLSSVEVGINPSAVRAGKPAPFTPIPSGVVTVAIGNNTWAGGDVAILFSLQGSLTGATLTIDGKSLVERGTLKE